MQCLAHCACQTTTSLMAGSHRVQPCIPGPARCGMRVRLVPCTHAALPGAGPLVAGGHLLARGVQLSCDGRLSGQWCLCDSGAWRKASRCLSGAATLCGQSRAALQRAQAPANRRALRTWARHNDGSSGSGRSGGGVTSITTGGRYLSSAATNVSSIHMQQMTPHPTNDTARATHHDCLLPPTAPTSRDARSCAPVNS